MEDQLSQETSAVALTPPAQKTAPKTERRNVGYAGFWRRVAASVIDGLVHIIAPLGASFTSWSAGDTQMVSMLLGGGPFIVMIMNIVFYFKDGQTIGYKALGLRVVSMETGKVPSAGSLIGRYFAKILSAIPLGLGFFWIGWDPKKQGFHDKIAGTVVIREREFPV